MAEQEDKRESVFLLGASGYIGEAIALALRRQGVSVKGLVRSDKSARRCQEIEVVPVKGEQQNLNSWVEHAAECSIIIDAIGYNDSSDETFSGIKKATELRIQNGHPAPLFIFTTGCMVYGTAGDDGHLLHETDVPLPDAEHPHGIPRYHFENAVLAAQGCVVRPSWVYGGSGGNSNSFFFDNLHLVTGTITIKGKGEKRYSWVHVDDLADAYVRICFAPRDVVKGQIFNISAKEYPSYEEILLAAAKASGINNPVIRHEDAYSRFLEVTVRIDPQKAKDILQWTPKHRGFIEEMDLYFPAWLLHHPPHHHSKD